MSKLIAVFDACVLYPAPLRDLLMHLATTDLFRAKWTNEIHQEWIRNLLKNRKDLTLSQLERTRDLMNSHVLDCLVEDYSHLIPTIDLKDKDDRHVVAAAIASHASMIVTYNIGDFPKIILDKYHISVYHPDDFVCHLFNLSNSKVIKAVQKQRKYLKNPPITALEFVDMFEKMQLKYFSDKLRTNIELI